MLVHFSTGWTLLDTRSCEQSMLFCEIDHKMTTRQVRCCGFGELVVVITDLQQSQSSWVVVDHC